MADTRTLIWGAGVFGGISGQHVHVPNFVIGSPLSISIQHRHPLLLGLLFIIPAESVYLLYVPRKKPCKRVPPRGRDCAPLQPRR